MSYLGKRIRNNYPLWSKVRNDDSSFGGILYDSIGKSFEELLVDLNRTSNSLNALQEMPITSIASIHLVDLNTISSYRNFIDRNRIISITAQESSNALNVFDDYSLFIREVPESISLSIKENDTSLNFLNLTLKKSFYSGDQVVKLRGGSKIYIKLLENILFAEPQSTEEVLEPKIILRGLDENNDEVEEIIYITSKKCYESKFKYKQLKDLVKDEYRGISGGTAIEFIGFEKNSTQENWIELWKKPYLIEEKQHKFYNLTKITDDIAFNLGFDDEAFNSVLTGKANIKLTYKLDINNNVVENYFEHLLYGFDKIYSWQREETLEYKERFINTLTKKSILNANEEATGFKVFDFDFDYKRNLIATISNDFILRYYEFNKTPFEKKVFDRTRFVNFEFEGEQYVSHGESSDIYLNLSREKKIVKDYFVARHTPTSKLVLDSNVNFDFEYLQDDGTWSSDFHYFERQTATNFLEDFTPIRINSGVYDEYGQYDYYVFSTTDLINGSDLYKNFLDQNINETTFKNELIEASNRPNQTKVNINHYSVMVDSTSPVSSYNLESEFLSLSNANNWGAALTDITSIGLHINNNEENLEFIINGSYIIETSMTYNSIFVDPVNSICALKDLFTNEVTITFNGSNESLTLSTEN